MSKFKQLAMNWIIFFIISMCFSSSAMAAGTLNFKWPGSGDGWNIYRGTELVTYHYGASTQALEAGTYTIKPRNNPVFTPFDVVIKDGLTTTAESQNGTIVIISPSDNETLQVTTASASSISQTAATSGGNVPSDGGSAVTARGVCWGTSQSPTVANSKTTDGSGTGSFTSSITGLTANTTYYVRAYATNSAGTIYGNQVSFTTPQSLSVPTVRTSAVSLITQTTAASGGNVISDGGASVTARGLCWSTSQNPTVSDSKSSDGAGTGTFTGSVTGLSPGVTYYVRSYATNSVGTGYGNQVSFTTQSDCTVSGYVRNSSTAYGISGVTLTFSNGGGSAKSDSSGYYSKTMNSGWI